jgi:hypothetical protein
MVASDFADGRGSSGASSAVTATRSHQEFQKAPRTLPYLPRKPAKASLAVLRPFWPNLNESPSRRLRRLGPSTRSNRHRPMRRAWGRRARLVRSLWRGGRSVRLTDADLQRRAGPGRLPPDVPCLGVHRASFAPRDPPGTPTAKNFSGEGQSSEIGQPARLCAPDRPK